MKPSSGSPDLQHAGTRRVYMTPATYKPDEAWMIEQSEAFIRHTKSERIPCKILMRDNDGKYSRKFLTVFIDQKIKTRRTALRSPNTVAFVERFVQTSHEVTSWYPVRWPSFGRDRG